MTSSGNSAIPWESIGRPLEELFRYERDIGRYEHAGYELISTVVHESDGSDWRRYLIAGENFAAVVGQVLTISIGEAESPKAALDSIREIVERAYARGPQTAYAFLDVYLLHRPSFPPAIRDMLDNLAKAGRRAIPLRVAAFAEVMQSLDAAATRDGAAGAAYEHWLGEIARGNITEQKARMIPRQLLGARDRLLDHLRDMGQDQDADGGTALETYSRVFKSRDIPAMTDLVLCMRRSKLNLELAEVELFLEKLSKKEAMRRFEILGEWMAEVNDQNYDGVVLTPVLAAHLAQTSDFEDLLAELDHLRAETRGGRFRIENFLQRDLEFIRFSSEYSRQHGGAGAIRDYYPMFEQLSELPPPHEEEVQLDEQHLVEVNRTAYEAVGFLRFLREFRSKTSRPIVVVGNDRYGRQWVVEPLEDYLKGDFILRYDRVPSNLSMRLKVRSRMPDQVNLGFPREFVKEINDHMPHIVIADSCTFKKKKKMMRYSRGTRDYVNWFAVFNDIRAEGDESRYEADSSLPPNHLAELKKWHEYVTVRRQVKPWVTPGETYRIAHWAPAREESVLLGDFEVACRDPDLSGDKPQVVLANPAVYLAQNEDVPDPLLGNRPYYFNDPENHVKAKILFGFGSYGFETRVVGPTTDAFVEAVQERIRAEIARLLES